MPVNKVITIAKPIKAGLIAAIPQPVSASTSVNIQLPPIATATARLGLLVQNGFWVRVIRIVNIALKIR